MVKMAKNRKKGAVLNINSTKGWSWSFSPTSRRQVLVGEEGKTLSGEKSASSPAFGSGWDAKFIRVKKTVLPIMCLTQCFKIVDFQIK